MMAPSKPAPAQPACQGSNPLLFEVQDWYQYGLEYCDRCPVQLWCLETVNPAMHYFDGVAGGLTWQNGRIIQRDADLTDQQMDYISQHGDLSIGTSHRIRQKDPESYDWETIHMVADGTLPWRSLTNGERREAAKIMAKRGDSTALVQERTRLNGTIIKNIFEGVGK